MILDKKNTLKEAPEYGNWLKEILVVSTTLTCQRVLKLGGDEFALYMFYVYTSCWQQNIRPRATDTYCMKGLGWGRDRFYKTKKSLVQNGFIKQIRNRDEDGQMGETYIHIEYHSTQNRSVGKPESGFQETNTLKDNEIPLNKVNTVKSSFGEFEKVKLTNEEHSKLVDRIGQKNTDILIAELDAYIASTGKRYTSHYATLLNWARRKIVEHTKTKSNIAF